MKRYEACLAQGGGQRFLSGGQHPSAADCALYGILERATGPAGDCGFSPPLPDLLNEYARLQKFLEDMRSSYPVRFKGKRRDKEKPRLPIAGLYQRMPMIPPGLCSTILGAWSPCGGR